MTIESKKTQIVFRASGVQALREKIRQFVDDAADDSVDGLSGLADEVEHLSSDAQDIAIQASRSKDRIEDAVQDAEEVESAASELESQINDVASSIRDYAPDNSSLVDELTEKITSMFSVEEYPRHDRTDEDTTVFNDIGMLVIRVRELRERITELTDDLLEVIDTRHRKISADNYKAAISIASEENR